MPKLETQGEMQKNGNSIDIRTSCGPNNHDLTNSARVECLSYVCLRGEFSSCKLMAKYNDQGFNSNIFKIFLFPSFFLLLFIYIFIFNKMLI